MALHQQTAALLVALEQLNAPALETQEPVVTLNVTKELGDYLFVVACGSDIDNVVPYSAYERDAIDAHVQML